MHLFQNEIEDFKQNYIYPTIFMTEKSEKSYPLELVLVLVQLLKFYCPVSRTGGEHFLFVNLMFVTLSVCLCLIDVFLLLVLVHLVDLK